MNKNLLKSPLNYTGNKYRILPQIFPYFPKRINKMIDLFCGGATVGINANAKEVIFIDSNERVIGLLNYLANVDFDKFLIELTRLAQQYNLSMSFKDGYAKCFARKPSKNKNNGLKAYNKEGFLKLRKEYNAIKNKNSNDANLKLYLLLVYGFNNDLRFNRNGEYNLPCGKTDLNIRNIDKVRSFNKKAKESKFTFICGDFRDKAIQEIIFESDFVYCDPPYLLTDAVYNEESGWNEQHENQLISLLNDLQNMNIPYVLSNVIEKCDGAIVNKPLTNFVKENKNVRMIDIKYHYRSSSYNKKNRKSHEREVIITNRKVRNENK